MKKPTLFQSKVQDLARKGESILLVAPTGLGKTFAATGDLEERFCKTIYAVPLRALCSGIQNEIAEYRRSGKKIEPVIHHGDNQESLLFGEEAIITTYDQVVCGVPGLPLSLPLKAGHAVAGALLMSRLILDEAHLAWGISDKALSILMGIVEFRQSLGLQTILFTATLPLKVATLISERLRLKLVIAGEEALAHDEGLKLRDSNREVTLSFLQMKITATAASKELDHTPLDERLINAEGKRIYFANTVDRIQATYDRLVKSGFDPEKIIVLHNRMPRSCRTSAEAQVHKRFGKVIEGGDWLLLTNQVAEAGLDISAPLVVSDPAPVDTLVQRAGRCARWFREGKTEGEFQVIKASKNLIDDRKKGLALPYQSELVEAALDSFPKDTLTWETERRWVNKAWGGEEERAMEAVNRALNETAFALNLFDRAAQQHQPGKVADAFREILSVEVAIDENNDVQTLQKRADLGELPETSSVSLRRAWVLLRESKGLAIVLRYEEGDLQVKKADYVQVGDTLIVPASVAHLHRRKGLCFGVATKSDGEISLSSTWQHQTKAGHSLIREGGRRQGLFEHVQGVMDGTYEKLTYPGSYRDALEKILQSLEPEKPPEGLADTIAQLSKLAAGFHDLGKADKEWQAKAREIDPQHPEPLIGRTLKIEGRIGRPHTPPGYSATVEATGMLLGSLGSAEFLVRAIALAAARHHSSLLNPALVGYQFEPHQDAVEFVRSVLLHAGVPQSVVDRSHEILDAARVIPERDAVPLLLPNDDLFPIYALVGRAILMADRENAAAGNLEVWRSDS
jgi:CRISPR-associated helicase Cas3